MRYTRSPLSALLDSTFSPCFFAAMERKPRTLCACHPLVFRISAKVAPLGRPTNAKIRALLLSARGATTFWVPVDWLAFLFLGLLFDAAVALPLAAFFGPRGAPFFCLPADLVETGGNATGALS